MGNTYRKERTYDDHGNGRRYKKVVNQYADRKQNKNKNFVIYEEDDVEFDDEYELDKNEES